MSEIKDKSIRQEERVAKLFNGKRTPQSGGGKWQLGDVLTDEFLVECKTSLTPKSAYSIKRDVLEKADKERREMNKAFSVLAFTFGDDKDYFVLDYKTMRFLLTCYDAMNHLDDSD